MSHASRFQGRRMPRTQRPSVLALEGRALLTASPRLDVFPLASLTTQTNRIVDGPGGDLWFTETGFNPSASTIGRVTPQGQISEIPLPTPPGGQVPNLTAIAAGPDGNLWAIDSGNDTIDRISPSGQVSTFPVPADQLGGNSGSIVLGADGNLWFTTGLSNNALGWSSLELLPNTSLNGTIDRITPGGVITSFALPEGDGVASSLAVGPDGIWFTDSIASRVGEMSYSGTAVSYSTPSPNYDGEASLLTVGPDGDAYFVESSGNSSNYLIKVAPGGAITPTPIPGTIPNEGNLLSGWGGVDFLDVPPGADHEVIDQLTPDGTLSRVATLPTEISSAGLAFGPDGNIWLAGAGPSFIGRLDVSPAPVPVPGPTFVGGAGAAFGPDTVGLSPLGSTPVGESATFDLASVCVSAGVKLTSATVDWGDGSSPTAGTFVADSVEMPYSSLLHGQVSGSHTYAKAGSYTVTVTIDGTGPTGAAMTTSVVALANAVDPTPTAQPPLVLQASRSLDYQGPLAIFSTPTPHDASGSDFTATVDWGDGSDPTTGTVVGGSYELGPESPAPFDPSPYSTALNLFEVSGDHTYARAGSFPIKVTLTDKLGHSSTESTSIQVEPGSLAVNPIAPITVTADPTPASSSFDQDQINLGSMIDFLSTDVGRTDAVSVDWGDGSSPTAGTLLPQFTTMNVATGAFLSDITGTHAYAQPGRYTIRITATDNQGDSATASTTAQITAGKLIVNPLPASQTSIAGVPIATIPLFAFQGPISADPPSDFTATVDWGDGSTPSTGTIASSLGNVTGFIPSTDGNLNISGEHTFARTGLYYATVTVKGPDGSTAQATEPIEVGMGGVEFSTTTTPSFTAGLAGLPTVLGNFQATLGSGAADFKATVDWGDGSPIQPAAIQLDATNPNSDFDILGAHGYARAGSYTITMTVIGPDGLPVFLSNQATVSAPVVISVPVTPPPAQPVTVSPTLPTTPPIVSTPPVVSRPPVGSPSVPAIMGPTIPTVMGPVVRRALPNPCAANFLPSPTKHPRKATPEKTGRIKPTEAHKVVTHPKTTRIKARPAHHAAVKPVHTRTGKKHPAGPAHIVIRY